MSSYIMIVVLMLVLPMVFTQDALLDIIRDKQIIVERLTNATIDAYINRCNSTCPQCVFSACGSRRSIDTGVCTELYGDTTVTKDNCDYQCESRNLDYTVSNVLTSGPNENSDLIQEKCWSSDLDITFIRNYKEDLKNQSSLRWQYFATTNGLVKLFPSHTQEICYTLDPRIRPWYVAATSGPKNIILVLDISASMLNYGRLGLAKEAATTVIQTLTIADYATVVVFSDSATQLLIPNQPVESLVQATYNNITALSASLSNVSANPIGGTNFEAALTKTFDILDSNSGFENNSANCHTAVLFLTDGFPNKGSTSQKTLIELVRQRNTVHKAVIFTYTFGSIAGASLARQIACATDGVYAHINDGGKLREQLSQYYDYFALLRQTDNVRVTWVEPYTDAVGAGLLVTASKAIYSSETSPPQLIGVIGADILVSDLRIAGEKAGKNFVDIIKLLASQNTCPAIRNFTECDLETIRRKGRADSCGMTTECESSPQLTCSMDEVNYCNYERERYQDSNVYRDESCCFNNTQFTKLLQCNSGWFTYCSYTCTCLLVSISTLLLIKIDM